MSNKRFRSWLASSHDLTLFVIWGGASRIAWYRIFSALLWVSLLSGYLPLVVNRFKLPKQRPIIFIVLFVVAVALVPTQLHDFMRAGVKKSNIREASIGYGIGVVDGGKIFQSGMLALESVSNFKPLIRFLRKNRAGIFSQYWTHWVGTRLSGINQNSKVVPGALTYTWPTRPNGNNIQGWVSGPHRGAKVVGIDSNGRIRAIACLGIPKHVKESTLKPYQNPWLKWLYAMNPKLPAILGWGRGWDGYAKRPYAPDKLNYYLVSVDKQIIARLKG